MRNAVLFTSEGKGSGLFLSQWRRRAPAKPVRARNVLVVKGEPTDYFRRLWRDAFPARRPLPERIAEKDGRGTDEFWDVFQ